MKSKKLSLKHLQVKSFVTGLNGQEGQTVKGGAFTDGPGPQCTNGIACEETIIPRKCPSMLCPC